MQTLIELYEQHGCLYITSDASYQNKISRESAFHKITEELNSKMLTNLSISEVKTKIKRLRTQYYAELNKIKKSEVSGVGTDGIYVPKWWCFELLNFLQLGNIVNPGQSNLASQESGALHPEQQVGNIVNFIST